MGFNKKFFTTGGIVASSPAAADEANFNTVLYTGNSTNDQSITGVGFQPDFVWIKARNTTASGTSFHGLWDSVRGTGGHLYSDLTNQETNTPNRLYSFDLDGFSLGNGVDPEYIGDRDYVAWCWKAGGAAVSGTGTGGASSVSYSANTDAGFSIVKFTAPSGGNVNFTATHGLSTTPELVITKVTSRGGTWHVWSQYLSNTLNNYLKLNDNNAEITFANMWGTGQTSSVISLRTDASAYSGEDHIAYCFHSVDGYQRVGSYTGDSSTNRIIYTTDDGTSTGNGGFQPRWVMIKAYQSSFTGSNWRVYDIVRGDDLWLRANGSDTETPQSSFEFDSSVTNGFRITDNRGDLNQSGDKFLFLAIA
jgi:hypothetical protein